RRSTALRSVRSSLVPPVRLRGGGGGEHGVGHPERFDSDSIAPLWLAAIFAACEASEVFGVAGRQRRQCKRFALGHALRFAESADACFGQVVRNDEVQ